MIRTLVEINDRYVKRSERLRSQMMDEFDTNYLPLGKMLREEILTHRVSPVDRVELEYNKKGNYWDSLRMNNLGVKVVGEDLRRLAIALDPSVNTNTTQ